MEKYEGKEQEKTTEEKGVTPETQKTDLEKIQNRKYEQEEKKDKQQYFFEWLKEKIKEKILRSGNENIIQMLEDGLRIKNPQKNERDIINEKYVKINRNLFMLQKYLGNNKAISDHQRDIEEIISNLGHIPTTMEIFLKRINNDKDKKKKIKDKVKELRLKKYRRKDFEWTSLAEMTMVYIIPKFLNKNCIAVRANQFDDIYNLTDLFLVSAEKDYNIALDITMREENNTQSGKDKLFIPNINTPAKIEYGLQYNKEKRGFKRGEISRLTWFYTRIDENLLKKYIEAVYNKEKKEEIEKIEKEIFITFCNNIKEQFQELQKKSQELQKKSQELQERRDKIQTKIEKLVNQKEMKKLIEKLITVKNNITKKLDEKRKFAENLDAALKNAHLFMEQINQVNIK